MQKNDSQKTGYLSRKSDNGTWSNRYISLSTDTGAMKFYVEKSGKKTMKSQINIKKGKFTPLTVEEAGKPFAFQILIEEMIGKSEDANLILAAPDEAQFNKWKEDIELCFTITDGRRRSSVTSAPNAPEPEKTVVETMKKQSSTVQPVQEKSEKVNEPSKNDIPEASAIKTALEPVKQATTDEVPLKSRLNEILAKQLQEKTAPDEPKVAPLERRPSKEEKSNRQYTSIEVIVTSDSEDGASIVTGNKKPPKSPHTRLQKESSTDSAENPSLNSPTGPGPEVLGALEEKLEKMGKRKSYKPPKKLGNLLNNKGLTPEVEEEMKRVKEGPSIEEKKTEDVEGIALVEAPVSPPAPKPRQLVISVRPTSPVREGYLYKLDNSMKEMGEDPWISQFISLEIATGILQIYAELGGRRISRGKVAILDSTVEPIDYVYHGRLYAFYLNTGPEGATDKIVSTFAAEDLESFSYWLISFDDCFKYQDDLKEKALREEEEKKELEMQRIHLAASMARTRSTSNVLAGADVGLAPERKASFFLEGVERPASRKPSLVGDSAGEKGLERKGSLRLDHLEQHLSREHSNDKSDPNLHPEKQRTPSHQHELFTTLKRTSSHHRSHEDPGPLSRPASFTRKDSHFAADDIQTKPVTAKEKEKEREKELEKKVTPTSSRSRAFTTGGLGGPLLQLNEHNSIDDLLRYDPDGGMSPEDDNDDDDPSHGDSVTARRRKSEHEMNEIKTITFQLKKAVYPADRLARRVKIWYCSGGFSLASEEEIHQFVEALKNTDDKTLKAFSEEKFEHINDWSNLLEVLRKYEQKVLAETVSASENVENIPELQDPIQSKMTFVYEIAFPSRPNQTIEFEFHEDFDFDALVKKMAEVFGFSELALFACIPPILANRDNPWCRGLVTVKEDLLFAEDLVLYQEEVIEHMWESYTALKSVIEQKDEVINQLYSQLSDLQDKVSLQSLPPPQSSFFGPTASTGTNTTPHNHGSSFHNLKALKASPKELQAIADREFYAADKDGDGRLSREEWRNWIQDKTNLIQEHHEVKTALMNEIKNLRKAMNPQHEQTFQELKKYEEIRKQQEEELVKVHIANDKLQQEVHSLQQRNKELEEEKVMIESDYQEKIKQLTAQLAALTAAANAREEEKEDSEGKQINAASNIIDNPYAYNYALDRSTGIQAKKEKNNRPLELLSDNNEGGGIDLLALANMNDKHLSQLEGFGEPLHPSLDPTTNSAQRGQPNKQQWQLESYAGETNRLGVDSSGHHHPHHNYTTPQTQGHPPGANSGGDLDCSDSSLSRLSSRQTCPRCDRLSAAGRILSRVRTYCLGRPSTALAHYNLGRDWLLRYQR